MNTVLLDDSCIQIFHYEIDIPFSFVCTPTLQHIQEQEVTTH